MAELMREPVRNLFKVFEGAMGTYARIIGEVETVSDTNETTYGWEGTQSVVLPQEGEVKFIYRMDGATRSYRDEYVADSSGVYRTVNSPVTYK